MFKTLLIAAGVLAISVALPATAQDSAHPYRASGDKPFWTVSIGRDTMRFAPLEGPEVVVPRPAALRGMDGTRYVTPGLTVDINHARCNNGADDRIRADTVMVTVGGQTLRGCGGPTIAPDRTFL